MDRAAPLVVDRPLRLGEVLARAIQLYGSNVPAFALAGTLQAAGFLIGFVAAWYVQLAVLSFAFVVSFAVVVRLAAGDAVGSAFRETLRSLPLLVPLGLIVAVPFYLGFLSIEFLVLSVAWLGLSAFAVPAAMLEEQTGRHLIGRLAATLRRTLALASASYLHAIGVAVVLVLVYLLVGNVLVGALFGFADQGKVAAPAIVQVVLAPFFFLGLTVLYFEQRVRLSAAHGPARQR